MKIKDKKTNTVFDRPEDLDRYLGRPIGTTRSRLSRGWSAEDCLNDKRIINSQSAKEPLIGFTMPDGSRLKYASEVDAYYKLSRGTTLRRLSNGWTLYMCTHNNNKKSDKDDKMYVFRMPDGSLLFNDLDVDNYYGLKKGTTYRRMRTNGWTVKECANNKSNKSKKKKKQTKVNVQPQAFSYTNITSVNQQPAQYSVTAPQVVQYNAPVKQQTAQTVKKSSLPPIVLTYKGMNITPEMIDAENHNRLSSTYKRLADGWSIKECIADGKADDSLGFVFPMPDGKILRNAFEVDEYYNLKKGTTLTRFYNGGWAEYSCSHNREGYVNRSSDYTVSFCNLYKTVVGGMTCSDVDAYYGLVSGTTKRRRDAGWTVEECMQNYMYREMVVTKADNAVTLFPEDVDAVYGLPTGTTFLRLKNGWTKEQLGMSSCQNNQYVLPTGETVDSVDKVEEFWQLEKGSVQRAVNQGKDIAYATLTGCGQLVLNFRLPNMGVVYNPLFVDEFYALPEGTTWKRINSGWNEVRCSRNRI